MEVPVRVIHAGFSDVLTSSQESTSLSARRRIASEEEDDLESLSYEPIVLRKTKDHSNGKVKASKYLIEQIKEIGVRKLIRFGCGKRILENICGRELVDTSTLQEYEQKVREYKSKRR